MPTPDELRLQLWTVALDAFEKEYATSVDTWKTLELKAQASITISGVFFAVAFAYARETTAFRGSARICLLICVISLLASVGSAILALRVRTLAAPPYGAFICGIVLDMIKLPDERLTDQTIAGFVSDRITQWQEATLSADAANTAKSRHIWISQMLLVIAMLAAAVVTFLRII